MSENKFELAARRKLRFPSSRGDLTVEQLFDLPLKHVNGFDLDSVAKSVNALLQQESQESFVEVKSNAKKAELELKLEIVKHVIQVKVEQRDQATKAKENSERRQVLLGLLNQKEQEALQGMTREQIPEELAKLDA